MRFTVHYDSVGQLEEVWYSTNRAYKIIHSAAGYAAFHKGQSVNPGILFYSTLRLAVCACERHRWIVTPHK